MEAETQNTDTTVPEKSETDAPDGSVNQPESAEAPAEADDSKKAEPDTEHEEKRVTAPSLEETKDETKEDATADDNKNDTKDEQKQNDEPVEDAAVNEDTLGRGDESPEIKTATSQRATPECLVKDKNDTNPETEPATAAEPSEKEAEASSALPAEPPAEPYSDTNTSREPSPEPQSKSAKSPELTQVQEQSEPTPPSHPQPLSVVHRSAHPSRAGVHTSLTLNQMAIAASAQNKLPISRIKGILERVSRHTESSAKKRGSWYKSETSYVDVNSYSWKNLSLYKDYQQHMWTGDGAIKSSCKK